MTNHDRHRQELAVAIVRGIPIPGPIPRSKDLSEAITTGLLFEGVVDVTVEVAIGTIGESRHVFVVIGGPDVKAAVAALMAAPEYHGLIRATVEHHLAG